MKTATRKPTSRWQQTVATAKADPTLRCIAAAILRANLRVAEAGGVGKGDMLAYAAFRDRADDLGLYVPNSAYYGILMGAVFSAVRFESRFVPAEQLTAGDVVFTGLGSGERMQTVKGVRQEPGETVVELADGGAVHCRQTGEPFRVFGYAA